MRITFGKVEEISPYSVSGVTEDIYWFDSDSRRAGHCTPFNTLLMNKKMSRELSGDVQDYVFLHENGHSSLSIPLTVLMYAGLIPTLLAALISPFAAIFQTIQVWISTASVRLTLISMFAGVVVIVLFTSLFTLVSWLSEGHAELFAIKKLGSEKYLDANRELREYADRGPLRTLLLRIQYPPPRLMIWISNKI